MHAGQRGGAGHVSDRRGAKDGTGAQGTSSTPRQTAAKGQKERKRSFFGQSGKEPGADLVGGWGGRGFRPPPYFAVFECPQNAGI